MKFAGILAVLGLVSGQDTCDMQDGQNSHGSNLKLVRLGRKGTADQCCDKCNETENCVGFTFIKRSGECYLKDALDPLAEDALVISGSMRPAPPSPPAPIPEPTPAPQPEPTPAPTPTPPASCEMTVQDGKNSGGSNMKMVKLSTAEECCNACTQTDGCIGFTLVKRSHECWLKDGLARYLKDDTGVVSGFAGPAPAPAPPVKKGCGKDYSTDPVYAEQAPIDWMELDLDMPPKQRWATIVGKFKTQLQDLVTTTKAMAGFVSKDLFSLLELLEKQNADVLLDAFPAPYGDEVKGIAAAGELTELDALICNLIYEITGACTSVIHQDTSGHITHAHNLDTAASWNFTTGQWELAEKLRAITVNVRFMKNGKNVYNATTYAGYAGIFEGMKAGKFSISVNTRFDKNLYSSLIQWITGKDRTGVFGTLNVRDALEKDETFEDAVTRLNETKLMGPGYFTIAGVNAGEGAIMSRNAHESFGYWTLADELAKGKPYMVQTNYDHWKADPFFDKRRTPCQKCMDDTIDAQELGFDQLFEVMSAKPNRNKMTCHTALFSARLGQIESYQQYCYEPGCRLVSEAVV